MSRSVAGIATPLLDSKLSMAVALSNACSRHQCVSCCSCSIGCGAALHGVIVCLVIELLGCDGALRARLWITAPMMHEMMACCTYCYSMSTVGGGGLNAAVGS